MNTSNRRNIDYASRIDSSSILFQEGGQAEDDEYKGGRQLILAYLDVTRDAEATS